MELASEYDVQIENLFITNFSPPTHVAIVINYQYGHFMNVVTIFDGDGFYLPLVSLPNFMKFELFTKIPETHYSFDIEQFCTSIIQGLFDYNTKTSYQIEFSRSSHDKGLMVLKIHLIDFAEIKIEKKTQFKFLSCTSIDGLYAKSIHHYITIFGK